MSLRVGTAVRDITPRVGGHLAGFAARHAPSERVNDPLTARAVAVTDGNAVSIVVALDVIALTLEQHRAWRERAARAVGVAPSSIVLSVTHTHGGPAVTPGALGHEPDAAYLWSLEEQIAEVVAEACSQMEPATVTHGAGSCADVARNRRQPGPIDPLVPVITICDTSGAAKAVVFSYACHPVVLGADNLAITADWPGIARRGVEQSVPGATAIYLQGCCGQLNTGHSPSASMTTAPQSGRTFAEAERIGARIAAAVVDGCRGEQSSGPVDVAVAERAVQFEFRTPGPGLAHDVDAWHAELVGAEPERAAILEMWLRWADGALCDMTRAADGAVAAHRWGDAVLSFLPGEPFVEMALDIRRSTHLDQLLTAGYSGGVPGYVPYPPDAYRAGGYEVDEAHRFYGRPGVVEPVVGSRIFDAAVGTINDVVRHLSC
ncbi:MAG: hypothetical protein WKF60_03240 [Ilumatobacter sp.]